MEGLQNDCKDVMNKIETKLHALHSLTRPSDSGSPMEVDENTDQNIAPRVPFARIDQVESNSPASVAVSINKYSYVLLQSRKSVVQYQ